MKRIFICAAAAIVALASCSKTQVVYNDAPEEIGFKAVSGVMTKAALGDQGHTTMGVFANYTDDKVVYFDDAMFVEGTEWTGSPAQYWPLTGSLDFAFYAPYDADAASRVYTTTSPAANKMSIIVDNSTTQVDWLYGAAMTTGTKASAVADISPTMKHLLAKIEINVKGSTSVTINEITLTDTEQKETATIDYANSGALSWTNTNATVDWEFLANTSPTTAPFTLSGTAKTFTCYVIPSAQTSFVLDYKISGVDAPDHTHSLTAHGNWYAGKKYVYNITVNPGEIKFTPTVTDWDGDINEDGSTTEADQFPVAIN